MCADILWWTQNTNYGHLNFHGMRVDSAPLIYMCVTARGISFFIVSHVSVEISVLQKYPNFTSYKDIVCTYIVGEQVCYSEILQRIYKITNVPLIILFHQQSPIKTFAVPMKSKL